MPTPCVIMQAGFWPPPSLHQRLPEGVLCEGLAHSGLRQHGLCPELVAASERPAGAWREQSPLQGPVGGRWGTFCKHRLQPAGGALLRGPASHQVMSVGACK